MARLLFVSKIEHSKFWDRVSELGKIYSPRSLEANYYFIKTSPQNLSAISLEGYRTSEPIKSFFFPVKSRVGELRREVTPSEEKIVLAGVRGCDLHSLKILDYVFKEGDFKDPFYISRRTNAFIIGSDCTKIKEVCFCTYFGIMPYTSEGCDMAVSSINEGMLVEAGSQKGEEFLKDLIRPGFLKDASSDQIKKRDFQRQKIKDMVNNQVREIGLPELDKLTDIVKNGRKNPVWEEKAKLCVECGACNMVCPTCHCFLLSDEKEKGAFSRYQMWDSCQYRLFSQVAGGANPRKYLYERVRNRFEKKFDFFKTILNIYACTGCGRCIEGCLAKIDLREILKKLAESLSVSAC